MSKKGKGLVDSFMFREAKEAVDKLSVEPSPEKPRSAEPDTPSVPDKDQPPSVSGPIRKKPDKTQINIAHEPDKYQRSLSPQYHDPIHSDPEPEHITKLSAPVPLSTTQSRVYLWLLNKGLSGVFSRVEIQNALSMPYITVRAAVKKLKDHDIVALEYNACQKDTYYTIDKSVKVSLKENISTTSVSYQDNIGIVSALSNSSSLLNKTTTANLELEFLKNPELGYWRQKGLKPRQVSEWCKSLNCSQEQMIEYLNFCRYEMVDLNVEETKPVKNAINWFYKIIEKAGSYPKPKGYKSFSEKRFEEEKRIFAQREKEAKELEALYRKKAEMEFDKEFWQMMNDPKGELYRRCFEQLRDYVKKRPKGLLFENGMKKAFSDLVAPASDNENQGGG